MKNTPLHSDTLERAANTASPPRKRLTIQTCFECKRSKNVCLNNSSTEICQRCADLSLKCSHSIALKKNTIAKKTRVLRAQSLEKFSNLLEKINIEQSAPSDLSV